MARIEDYVAPRARGTGLIIAGDVPGVRVAGCAGGCGACAPER
ncbi:hypothetical protein GJR88_03410 [Dietzia sp. DQ12-45-1b]|nr:hypothetical protein GJR88_03410 [Dietzia sp. DQ12-45-1b]